MRSAFVLVLLSSTFLSAQTTTPEKVSDVEIRKAIEELGAAKFATREKASAFLESLGRRAEPFLEEASKSRDEEVSRRARDILAKYEWGLYPDTPKDISKLITDFKGGQPEDQIQVIRKLCKMRPLPTNTVFRLLQKIEDGETRIILSAELAAISTRLVPELLLENEPLMASRILELTADLNERTAHNYAIYQHLTGNTDKAIAIWKAALKAKNKNDNSGIVLLHLYRMKKDWVEGKKLADQIPQEEFKFKIRWEANDWKGILDIPELAGFEPAEKATLHQLMGDTKKFRETLDEMKKGLNDVEGNDGIADRIARILLVNGYGNEAVKLLMEKRSSSPSFTFELICAQGKYKEAFAFADLVKKEAKDNPSLLFALDLSRAKMLAQLGDRDGAIQLYRKIMEDTKNEQDQVELTTIIMSADRAGLRRFAVELLCEHIEKVKQAAIRESMLLGGFNSLDDHRGELMSLTYLALRSQGKKETTAQTVARLFKIMDGTATKEDYESAADGIERYRGTPIDNDPTPQWFHEHLRLRSAAQILKIGKLTEKADAMFEKAIATKVTELDIEVLETRGVPSHQLPAGTRLLYAESLLERKDTKGAIKQFEKLVKELPTDPLVAFLYGKTLIATGNEKEGKRLLDVANLISLADSDKRIKFSEDLSERGFTEEARKQIDTIMDTSWFDGVAEGNAHVRTARYVARRGDYKRAADLYEKDLAQMVFSTVSFVSAQSYMTVPQVVKTYRAQALLKEGKTDEAMKLIRDALENVPKNVDLAIGVIPNLTKLGKKKEADEIYATVKKSFEVAIKDHPNSPELRNSMAWVMVNCIRDLEEARKHAEKAVEIAPESAGYMDTLAEIRFRQGDRKEALALMQKCITKDPKNAYFRKQLIRFEKSPFDSPTPDEETGED